MTVGMLFGASIYAQDPYLRPPLTDRESMADSAGVIPQLNLAMMHANVVDVRSGAILRDVTVAVRDGKIVSVGNDDPPAGRCLRKVSGHCCPTNLLSLQDIRG